MPSVFECPILAAVDAGIEANVEKARQHLGMSGIAMDARTLWLQYRWSLPEDITPRTRRIFALGHILEAEVIRLLRQGGFEVHSDDGSGQYGFKRLGGNYGGSIDFAVRGLPQAPNKWHIGDVKSAKDSKFKEFVKKGYEEWNPVYYGQAQCYMHYAGLDRFLAVVYNKDTSELKFERVELEPGYAEAMEIKAEDIIRGPIPESTYPDRTWYEIAEFKSEEYQRVYWGDELPYNVNCRNCRFSIADVTPDKEAGEWGCIKKRQALSFDEQRAGCSEHNFIPDLMPAKQIAIDGEAVTYRAKNGQEFTNGPEKFSSKECAHLSRTDFDESVFQIYDDAEKVFGDVTLTEGGKAAWEVAP